MRTQDNTRAGRRCRRCAALAVWLMLLGGCTGIPTGVEPVSDFELERYLGRWYEIARLDHRFERGLTAVTAEYSRREEGGVRVVNRGYDADAGEWQSATGKAFSIDAPDTGRLKVSFFGPFYGAYNVIALDDDYRWAMIAGPTRDYLWILARTPTLDDDVVSRLVGEAERLDFPTGELIFVDHDAPEAGP